MDDDKIKHWLACYNLKSRVRGLDDRSRLDDPVVRYRYLPGLLSMSFIPSRKSASFLAPMWVRCMYRRGSPLFSPGSVVSSAPNQNHLWHQESTPPLSPSPRPLLLIPQAVHHLPPLPLHPCHHPHQRARCHRSIHWLCSIRHAPSAALSSTGSLSLKVLPTSLAGQSSALVCLFHFPLIMAHITSSQQSTQRHWDRQESESGKGRSCPSRIPSIGLGK